jgi:SAM-dependent methyltransferase
MPTILNLGAGSVEPLQKSDLANITEFRDWDVVNLDIYNQIVKYSPDRSQRPFPSADIRYSDVERRIDFQDGSVDIALAVSPYGYSVLNSEVHRVLKRGGVAVVLGSQRNKFVCKLDFLCARDMRVEFFEMWEIIAPNQLAWKCINFLAQRGSHVSSGHEATKLDFFGIYRKI